MKRTHYLSSDTKTPQKQVKLNPILKKTVLQPLPKASSPVLIENQVSLEESSKSPRIKRDIKSQINFLYSPKNDNLKLFGKNGPSKPSLVKTDRNHGQNETTSHHFDALITETSRSGRETNEIFSSTKEKNSSNKSSLEKKILRVQLKEKSLGIHDTALEESKSLSQENYFEVENEQTVSDDSENLKKLISEQSAAYLKLEEMYCLDTNSLKREVERLKTTIKRQDIDMSSYRSRIDLNANEFEDIQKRLSAVSKEKERLVSQYEDDLAIKNSEIFQMNEIINKLKLDRKNKDDQIKDLQRQLLVMTNCNKIIENDLCSVKKELSIATQTLENNSSKLQLFDAQSDELSEMRKIVEDLEDKLKDSTKSVEFVSNNYKVLQNKFNHAKDELEEKSSQLSDALNKLSETGLSSKSPVKPVLRRTSTLSSSSTNLEVPKENFSRLYQKIVSLEEELQHEKIEKEKVCRNFEYSKKMIDEKLLIISRLESKIQSDYLMQIEVTKESFAKNVFEHLDICLSLLQGIQDLLTCSKCKKSPEGRFISWDCEHVFCKTCAMFQETCPCCSNGSRVLRPKLLKRIYSKLPKQLEQLETIKKLFSAKS